MKSMRVQRGYICLPSLCLHYVELNKVITRKTRRPDNGNYLEAEKLEVICKRFYRTKGEKL